MKAFGFFLMTWLSAISLATCQRAHAVIELRGEFLLFKPSYCDSEYATVDCNPCAHYDLAAPNGEVHRVATEYEPGFRASLGYLNCESLYNASLTYTYLRHTKRNEIRPCAEECALWPAFGRPEHLNRPLISAELPELGLVEAHAKARDSLRYDALELQVGHRYHASDSFCLRTWGAIHYAYLDRTRRAHYQGVDPYNEEFPHLRSAVRWKSRAWGIGPKVGVDIRRALFCHLHLSGIFSTGLLGGERKRAFRQVDKHFASHDESHRELTDIHFKNSVTLFSEVNARLGLSYGLRCGGCWTLLVEVGYEFVKYINALETLHWTGPESSFDLICQDASLDGFYVAGRFEF